MTGPTQFIEANAILAAQERDADEMKQLVKELLPNEQLELRRAALYLVQAIEDWGSQ